MGKKETLDDSDVIKALYHMYCAAVYKGSVTMSSETAIGLYNFFNSQKAEIERLKIKNELIYHGSIKAGKRLIEKHKAEAIKEFAERLKNKLTSCSKTIDGKHEYLICDYEIDNLVKEMVGDV